MESLQGFASCQRKSQSAAFGYSSNLLAYASNNLIALYDPFTDSSNGPINIIRGHADKVQSVKFITRTINGSTKEDDSIISVSADKTAKVWTLNSETNKIECIQTLKGHSESLTCVGVLGASSSYPNDIIVTGSSDGTMGIWIRSVEDTNFYQAQTICLDKRYPQAISLYLLPQSSIPIIAVGATDKILRIYVLSADNDFVKVCSLQGHTDWITCIDIIAIDDHSLLLASGSLDKCIRLWKITDNTNEMNSEHKSFEDEIYESISTKSHTIPSSSGLSHSIYLESVLLGHDDWVQSVQWLPFGHSETLKLLSASSDKSMIVWSADPESGIWTNEVHVGEMGGSSQGLFGALWGPDGKSFVGHDYYGDFSVWKQDSDTSIWKPFPAATGHFNAVMDMRWDPSNTFLATVSLDQTTRVWAQVKSGDKLVWHEIARPQVHGYDLQALTFINPFEFFSGADGEKVIRMFHAPTTFGQTLNNLIPCPPRPEVPEQLPLVAELPALGLSNKAVDMDSQESLRTNIEAFKSPPLASELQNFTLWPESDKLYGHGDSIYTLQCSHDGNILVSASVGRSGGRMEDTALRIWRRNKNINRFQESQDRIQSHQLTVTDIKFSWSDKYFASAGRDRQWSLFGEGEGTFGVIHQFMKSHARIIWGLSWSFDDKIICTGSRDKTVSFWNVDNISSPQKISSISFEHAVTAVEFLPTPYRDESGKMLYVLGVGFENGDLAVIVSENGISWYTRVMMNSEYAHGGAVKRWRWRVVVNPTAISADEMKYEYLKAYFPRVHLNSEYSSTVAFECATCSEDFSTRVWSVKILSDQ